MSTTTTKSAAKTTRKNGRKAAAAKPKVAITEVTAKTAKATKQSAKTNGTPAVKGFDIYVQDKRNGNMILKRENMTHRADRQDIAVTDVNEAAKGFAVSAKRAYMGRAKTAKGKLVIAVPHGTDAPTIA